MKTDIQIAQEARMEPIVRIAEKLSIPEEELELYGKYKAKISDTALEQAGNRPKCKRKLNNICISPRNFVYLHQQSRRPLKSRILAAFFRHLT